MGRGIVLKCINCGQSCEEEQLNCASCQRNLDNEQEEGSSLIDKDICRETISVLQKEMGT